MHTQALESIAAVESLARKHVPEDGSRSELRDEILALASSLRSRAKRHLTHLLTRDGPGLAERLVSVTALLGSTSPAWLLGSEIRDWATVVAHVRNRLAHGTGSPTRIEQDPTALIAVLESVRVVQRLATLRLAGSSPDERQRSTAAAQLGTNLSPPNF